MASIAPDGCVDLIRGAAIDSPATAIVAEIDSSHTELVRADIIDPNDCPNLGGQGGGYGSQISVDTSKGGYVIPGGGYEGEPIFDPVDCPDLVDHVFEQYAEDEFQITDQHYFAVR